MTAAEILTVLSDKDVPIASVPVLELLHIDIVDFTNDDAQVAANLRIETKHKGLSLGDRACLALGRRLSLPVYTADRIWGQLAIGIDIRVIR